MVIPCRNEVRAIDATVRAILDSTHTNLEVLVIDGMSDDGTRAVLERLTQHDPRVRIVDNPHRLTPYAFNLGVLHARGDYVQIVGSRNVLDKNYISILLKRLQQRPDVACMGGDYQHVFDGPQSRYISLSMESKFGVGSGNYRTMSGDCYVDTVGIPLYRRGIFTEIGTFDQNLTRNQDDEFNYRVREAGYKIMYVHAAKATYLVRGSIAKAFHQFFQYGYFKVFVNRKHRAVTTIRQVVPAAFVAVWAVGFPLSFFVPALRLVLSAVAVTYLLLGINFAGHGLSLKERLMVVGHCLVLHVAYGLGYWQGIYDFLLLNREPRPEFQRQTT